MIKNNDFQDVITNRKSIRKYKDINISRDEIIELLDFSLQAPSSRNMQPWEFVIVESPEAKKDLQTMVYTNTEQVRTASFSVIIFITEQPEKNIQDIIDGEVAAGNIALAKKDKYIDKLTKSYESMPQAMKNGIANFDAGILTGNLIHAARHFGYDTNVLGGFERSKVKSRFAPTDDLQPAIVITVGLADEDGKDTYRLPARNLTKFM